MPEFPDGNCSPRGGCPRPRRPHPRLLVRFTSRAFQEPCGSPGARPRGPHYPRRPSHRKHIVCELSATGAPVGGNAIAFGAMDRSPRHDRPFARHHPRCSRARAYPCAIVIGERTRAAVCGPPAFRSAEFRDLSRAKAFSGPGAEPLTVEPADFARLFRGRKLAIKAAC